MARWFNVQLSVEIGHVFASLATPDWTVENPLYRPCMVPRLISIDYDKVGVRVSHRYHLNLVWFFQFSLAFGHSLLPGDDLN